MGSDLHKRGLMSLLLGFSSSVQKSRDQNSLIGNPIRFLASH